MLCLSLAAISSLDSTLADMSDANFSIEEKVRLASFTRPHRRRQFLAGRILSRRLLVEAYGGEAADWAISADAASKPVIVGREDIHLSISHSAGYIACAIASQAVGLDIEHYNPRRNTEELIAMVCNPSEQAAMADLNPQDQCQQFLELWTLKEAWLKRSGKALDVSRIRGLPWLPAQAADAEAATWYFQEAGIAVSLVCTALADMTLDWRQLSAPARVTWRKFV